MFQALPIPKYLLESQFISRGAEENPALTTKLVTGWCCAKNGYGRGNVGSLQGLSGAGRVLRRGGGQMLQGMTSERVKIFNEDSGMSCA